MDFLIVQQDHHLHPAKERSKLNRMCFRSSVRQQLLALTAQARLSFSPKHDCG